MDAISGATKPRKRKVGWVDWFLESTPVGRRVLFDKVRARLGFGFGLAPLPAGHADEQLVLAHAAHDLGRVRVRVRATARARVKVRVRGRARVRVRVSARDLRVDLVPGVAAVAAPGWG